MSNFLPSVNQMLHHMESQSYFLMYLFSARHKIDEDLAFLDRQLKLMAGEEVEPDPNPEASRPAEVLLGSRMVFFLRLNLFLIVFYLGKNCSYRVVHFLSLCRIYWSLWTVGVMVS